MSELKAYSEVFGFCGIILFFSAMIARAYVLFLEINFILNANTGFN
ncbi:hypothetical protein KKB99_01640 [bacterium]|nr:hypothetical protein [bacterium]MBU1024689.1 hypothetical protein [bacterium]